MTPTETWLVGDIGATNARFGLVSPEEKLLHTRTYACENYPAIEDAIAAYLGDRGELPAPRQGAIAIASAITGDRVVMTNHPWSFSVAALKSRLGLDRLVVINDFTALAMALPHLGPQDRLQIGGGTALAGAPMGVLGPGSGLGVSGLVKCGSGWQALTGEGGHATMAPASDRESAALDHMRRHFDHVSAERVLSGPGLVNLYNALAALDGVPSRGYTPAQITDLALRDADPLCAETRASVLRDAGDDGLESGADPRCPWRNLCRGRHRAAPRAVLRRLAVPRALRGEGPVPRLYGSDPDLCRDPPAAGLSWLRRPPRRAGLGIRCIQMIQPHCPVGWVERSETHLLPAFATGFMMLNPSYICLLLKSYDCV